MILKNNPRRKDHRTGLVHIACHVEDAYGGSRYLMACDISFPSKDLVPVARDAVVNCLGCLVYE
jgi:hypothetical protein